MFCIKMSTKDVSSLSYHLMWFNAVVKKGNEIFKFMTFLGKLTHVMLHDMTYYWNWRNNILINAHDARYDIFYYIQDLNLQKTE